MLTLSEKAQFRVPISSLWAYLKNTDGLNKAIGLSPVSFAPDSSPYKKGYYRAATKLLGFWTLSYEEFPFEWIENRYYHVLRKFHGGPVKWILAGIRLVDKGDSIELEVFAEVEPNNWLGHVMAKIILRQIAVQKVIDQAQLFVERSRQVAQLKLSKNADNVNEGELNLRLSELSKNFSKPKLIEQLGAILRDASDVEVSRLRPFELADRWKENRYDVLYLLLFATKTGVVDLVWDITCPHCRADVTKANKLSDLKSDQMCATCEVRFNADLSNSVEVTFKVNQGIRQSKREIYCIGGPGQTPNILAQLRLEKGAHREELITVFLNDCRIRTYPARAIEKIKVSLTAEKIRVENSFDGDVLLAIEKDAWLAQAATAGMVISSQQFKDLFPGEAVAAGSEIAIGKLVLMFTDLQGSTALYQNVGDAKAFDVVLAHFQYLIDKLSKCRGGLVKTMGDAIMASFFSAEDALRAALMMQKEWNQFRVSKNLPSHVKLKIGIHQGASIAINNNGQLDYFGNMVNTAARVQSKSMGGDIVLSEAVYSDPAVEKIVNTNSFHKDKFSSELKGLSGDQKMLRIIL